MVLNISSGYAFLLFFVSLSLLLLLLWELLETRSYRTNCKDYEVCLFVRCLNIAQSVLVSCGIAYLHVSGLFVSVYRLLHRLG